MSHLCAPTWWHHNSLSVSKTSDSKCETPDALWVTTALKQMCSRQTLPSTHNCTCFVYDLIHKKCTHITEVFSLMTSPCSVCSWGDSLNEIMLLRLEDDIISGATADDCTAETGVNHGHTHNFSLPETKPSKRPQAKFTNKWHFIQ